MKEIKPESAEAGFKHNTAPYIRLHEKIRELYGKADSCESENCTKKSKRFDWALIPGREYSTNREDYQMLCRSCHMKLDSSKGNNHAFSKLTSEAAIFIKQNVGLMTQDEMAKKFNVCRQTISSVITNKNWAHIKI